MSRYLSSCLYDQTHTRLLVVLCVAQMLWKSYNLISQISRKVSCCYEYWALLLLLVSNYLTLIDQAGTQSAPPFFLVPKSCEGISSLSLSHTPSLAPSVTLQSYCYSVWSLQAGSSGVLQSEGGKTNPYWNRLRWEAKSIKGGTVLHAYSVPFDQLSFVTVLAKQKSFSVAVCQSHHCSIVKLWLLCSEVAVISSPWLCWGGPN